MYLNLLYSAMIHLVGIKLRFQRDHLVLFFWFSFFFFREIPEVELSTLLQGLRDIYDCNLRKLPVDVLTNSNLINLVQESFRSYTHCLQTGEVSGDRVLKPHPSSSRSCKSSIRSFCPGSFGNGQLDKCRATLFPLHEHLREVGGVMSKSKVPNMCSPDNGSGCILKSTLNLYMTCMKNSHNSSRPCLTLLERSCHSAQIRALKAIRLRVSMLKDVIAAVPEIKIVVALRDPRGTALSRQATGLLSHVAKDLVNETRLLCKRLKVELDTLFQLEKDYPNRIMHFRYEDYVRSPLKIMQTVYDFIEQVPPANVSNWFAEILNADKDGGAYSTSRKDSLRTAYKWRGKLSTEALNVLTSSCVDVLKTLDYRE